MEVVWQNGLDVQRYLIKDLEEWLLTEPNTRVQIIFKISEGENAVGSDVVRHLINLYQTGTYNFASALGEWYKIRNYDVWSKKYTISESSFDIETFVKAQLQWCSSEKIEITPLLLVNGFHLPESYGLETLQVLFE